MVNGGDEGHGKESKGQMEEDQIYGKEIKPENMPEKRSPNGSRELQ